eukprot:5444067-Pyramimonas_sp.AAC.1
MAVDAVARVWGQQDDVAGLLDHGCPGFASDVRSLDRGDPPHGPRRQHLRNRVARQESDGAARRLVHRQLLSGPAVGE